MSNFLERMQKLVGKGEVRISDHGYDELADDGVTAREVVAGIVEARTGEEYPNYPKGPCVLLLPRSRDGSPIHVVWAIPKGHEKPAVLMGHDKPAVLIPAYRPDPARWDKTFVRRK